MTRLVVTGQAAVRHIEGHSALKRMGVRRRRPERGEQSGDCLVIAADAGSTATMGELPWTDTDFRPLVRDERIA